ncbi:TPA: hypothetical protein ACH3X3_015077 [Trebouxia sp. C0006]
MVLLEWCTGELPGNEYTPEEVEDLVALKRVLVVLLHQLLLSHIMIPKLSMERIFRFGFVTIMNCWITHESDIVLINNLGFAFLRRISSDKAILETMGNADLGRQADSVYSIWNLLHAGLETPWEILGPQQLRCTEAIEALYAAPPTKRDSTLLANTSELTSAFSLAIEYLPTLSDRLTACAVFAQLC